MPLRNGTVYSIYSKLRLIKNLNPEEKNLHAEGDSTKDLHSALLAFQKEKIAAGLGEKTGQFGKYSDLKTTLQAVQLATKFGIVHHVTFHPIGENTIMVRLTITHVETGQKESSEYPVSTVHPGEKNQHQATGKAITYAKKNLYWGLYGLANADDDCDSLTIEEEKDRGQNLSSPVSYNNHAKEPDFKSKERQLYDEVKELYMKDKAFATQMIDNWKTRNQIKKTFSVETLSDNEIYLDLRKQVTAYNLDHKK